MLDVRLGTPAANGGIVPGVTVMAINNRQYSATVLHDAIAAATKSGTPIEFLVKDGEIFQTHRVDYHAGEKYPYLERDSTKPDLLSAILAPRVK